MAYDFGTWMKRHRERIDISSTITHLTRPSADGAGLDAVDVLLKILREKKIKGGTGYVCNGMQATCFQDAPLLGLAQNVRFEKQLSKKEKRNPKYVGCGLAFPKLFAFDKGARPVFYEKSASAKGMLKPEEHWRIVSLDLSNNDGLVDWTHEREWRCLGDFEFEWSSCIVVLGDIAEYRKFVSTAGQEILTGVSGLTLLSYAIV